GCFSASTRQNHREDDARGGRPEVRQVARFVCPPDLRSALKYSSPEPDPLQTRTSSAAQGENLWRSAEWRSVSISSREKAYEVRDEEPNLSLRASTVAIDRSVAWASRSAAVGHEPYAARHCAREKDRRSGIDLEVRRSHCDDSMPAGELRSDSQRSADLARRDDDGADGGRRRLGKDRDGLRPKDLADRIPVGEGRRLDPSQGRREAS